jgi:uncharacterized C2H2 Zn-finger protein
MRIMKFLPTELTFNVLFSVNFYVFIQIASTNKIFPTKMADVFCSTFILYSRFYVISCDRCGIEFFLAKEYKEHYQTHTHTFHCEKCDRRFIKIGTLHNHQCSPPEGFQCSYCSREFKTQRFYQNHMNTHLDFLTQ